MSWSKSARGSGRIGILVMVWGEATTRNYDIWSNRLPLMFPAYTPEFLPLCALHNPTHYPTLYYPPHVLCSTCVLTFRDSTLGVRHCANWKQCSSLPLMLDHRTLPEHRQLLQARQRWILETERRNFQPKNLRGGRKRKRQKYITPPTISFVWILFGLLHREPK